MQGTPVISKYLSMTVCITEQKILCLHGQWKLSKIGCAKCAFYLQLGPTKMAPLLNKYYQNEGTFNGNRLS